jgi:hypothetical protein
MTKDSLKRDIDIMWNIYQDAYESFCIAKYLTKPDTKEELVFVNRSLHFKWITESLWKVCVIDLFKLYNHQEYFSIHKLRNRIKQSNYPEYSEKGVLELIKTKLKHNKEVIKQINTIRNKRLAHRDENQPEIDIKIKDVEELFKSTEDILQSLYSSYFQTHFMFRSVVFGARPFDHIKNIIAYLKIRKEEDEKLLSNFS